MLTIKLDADFVKRADQLAEKADMTRHKLIKTLVEVGIEELEAFSNLDFFKVNSSLGFLRLRYKKLPEDTRQILMKF